MYSHCLLVTRGMGREDWSVDMVLCKIIIHIFKIVPYTNKTAFIKYACDVIETILPSYAIVASILLKQKKYTKALVGSYYEAK